MVLENIHLVMEIHMKANTLTIKEMERENISQTMDLSMKVSLWMTKSNKCF